MGKTRPISIIEVIRNAKAEARKIGAKAILKYFTLNQTGMFVRLCFKNANSLKMTCTVIKI
jgi:hypothetical protein